MFGCVLEIVSRTRNTEGPRDRREAREAKITRIAVIFLRFRRLNATGDPRPGPSMDELFKCIEEPDSSVDVIKSEISTSFANEKTVRERLAVRRCC